MTATAVPFDQIRSTPITEAEGAALIAAKPSLFSLEEDVLIAVPIGFEMQDIEQYLQNPRRAKGTIAVNDLASFGKMIDCFGTPNECRIYVQADYSRSSFSASAVFNDHRQAVNCEYALPGWRDHRCTFSPVFTEEWKRWTSADKKAMGQVEFAEFIDSNISDINSPEGSGMPEGAQVLEFATKLSETRTVKFGSGINLQNGMVQFNFTEEGEAGTAGQLTAPKRFAIAIAPFFGSDHYRIDADFRYRIDRNSGKPTFWYELRRPDKIIQDACKALVDGIESHVKECNIPVIYGTAG